ncbi:MAG: superoxide dismutase [Candidatus Moranbacteria bacterium RIFOXYA12_FULL_44_15]|nr:MAG: superoxide dismutase [Candidatus Moranbacteria bacterium RIFOXYA12_FULL_44_15]OGI35575.1 MAG: superoxide dismutase [Candidatus Moranbacteria bacterium RIFOXYA2_FULL_43_15]
MYVKKDYSKLVGMEGFSEKALTAHFALYEGYVKNTNRILEELGEYKSDTIQYAELKRRLGWEFDGMRLHEYYFSALGGNGEISQDGALYKMLAEQFGSFENWKADFVATAKMRGIGWSALYQDVESGKLINFWINEHNEGHPAGANLILNLDVFEHAYIFDYGTDRSGYIDAYMKNLDWVAVEKRLK